MRTTGLTGCVAALLLGVVVAAQQKAPAPAPVNTDNPAWTTPVAPFKIVGPVPSMAGEIEKSITTLGFKPADIKILLTTQAHFDHAGTMAHFQKLSKASVRIMQGDD